MVMGVGLFYLSCLAQGTIGLSAATIKLMRRHYLRVNVARDTTIPKPQSIV